MGKDDGEQVLSQRTIDDVDEKMKRLKHDNFKLNSHRAGQGKQLQTSHSKMPSTTKNKKQHDTLDLASESNQNQNNGSGFNFYAKPDDLDSQKRTDTELSDKENDDGIELEKFLEEQGLNLKSKDPDTEVIQVGRMTAKQKAKSQRFPSQTSAAQVELKRKQKELKAQLDILEQNKKLMKDTMDMKQKLVELTKKQRQE